MTFCINEVTPKEYSRIFNRSNIIFDTAIFNELNSHKCEQIIYLLFNDDNKTRFGLIGGIKDRVLKLPYSSPFFLLSYNKENKMIDYHEAIKALINYIKVKEDISEIYLTLPPSFYNETHITNMQNALFTNGFSVNKLDVNYHYNVSEFSDNYMEEIDIKARQKLRASLKFGLTFHKVTKEQDIISAYNIIRNNRESKGYPLHMSLEDVFKTIKVVTAEFFMVKNELNESIAAAMIFEVSPKIVLVVYWGNMPGTDNFKPMNYLAYKVFEYYKSKGKTIVDIGISTENSIPNFGLCDFKQGIGCRTNAKMAFSYNFF